MRIGQLLNGTNGIDTLAPTSLPRSYNMQGNYSFAHLHLYRNESRNLLPLATSNFTTAALPTLNITKSADEVYISRAFVDFITDELSLEGLISELESPGNCSADGICSRTSSSENFLASLNADDTLKVPGGFTQACRRKGHDVENFERWVQTVTYSLLTIVSGTRPGHSYGVWSDVARPVSPGATGTTSVSTGWRTSTD